MEAISLMVSVPVCSFRKPYAREFFETERVPPPSTVYGFLLSLIGEEDRKTYIGTKLAIAVIDQPAVSTILRTTWRIKSKAPPGTGNNKKPDYQEILTGLKMFICVRDCDLANQIRNASGSPQNIVRFGGLSVGESRDLVNDIDFDPELNNYEGNWLVQDEHGKFPLPVWVDHVGSKGTMWRQFTTKKNRIGIPSVEDQRWITIVNQCD
jgi:CRISPR-associated protein Cas5t